MGDSVFLSDEVHWEAIGVGKLKFVVSGICGICAVEGTVNPACELVLKKESVSWLLGRLKCQIGLPLAAWLWRGDQIR